MNEWYTQGQKGALQGTLLVPVNVRKLTPEEDDLKKEFAVELPMSQMFEQEVSLWCLIGVSDVIIFLCSQPKCSLKICMVMNHYGVPC